MKINNSTPDKHKYLSVLSHIPRPPERLFYRGQLPKERVPTVAIIGTRKPTPYGKEVAQMLAYDLARRGVVIVSGLALGVDSLAHRAALEAGGVTIAVLANSVDHIYPRSHAGLAEQIINNSGAILSEYEPPTDARDFQFLARNRIVSGLSDGVIIIEAAARSGTLSTAAHALQQGKEIFAVPGNITNPLSAGCNMLIRQGATPVTSAQDVLDVIVPHVVVAQTPLPLGDTPLETKIIELLQTGIRDGDTLHRHSGANASEFNQALTMMEINGVIHPLGGNQWTLR